ncbi:MAG: alpha/beta hydrolase [Oligoflexus sp.]
MQAPLSFQRIADLDCLVTPFDEERGTIILLHGYGANFQDLAGLAPMVDRQNQWNWIFPNGILEVPIGPHTMGRAWFPIDMEALQRQLMGGEVRSFASHIPTGLAGARDQIGQLIESLPQDLTRIVVGGFSQGAMISCHASLCLSENPKALLQLSSTLVAKANCNDLMHQHQGLQVFQSHGQNDPILPITAARELHQLFQDAGAEVDYSEFAGGHEIPLPVLQRLQGYLQSLRS